MSEIAIARYDSNEISKSADHNFGETQNYENLSVLLGKLFSGATADVVVYGLSVQERASPSMAVDITAGLAICWNTGKLAHVGALFGPVTITNGGASARIDTLEIRVKANTYDTQQRAFKDASSGDIAYQDFATKQKYEIEAQVIAGTEGAGVAPNHTTGWIKLAEIAVDAGESTSILDADIGNIDAGYDGEANSTWTAETTASFKPKTVSEIKELFRAKHSETGDHSNDVIGDQHIDWGTGANQVSAADMPIVDSKAKYTGTEIETALGEIDSSQIHVVTGANYTILDNDGYGLILIDPGAADRTIDMPTLAANQRRKLIVMHTGAANKVIIDGEGAETIRGSATQTLFFEDELIVMVGAASEWKVLYKSPIYSTGDPSGGSPGDTWYKHEA